MQVLTHFADSTETKPSFSPSFSRITECGYLVVLRNWNEAYESSNLLPRVDQARPVHGTPAKVFDIRNVRGVLIKLAHMFDRKAFKGLAVASSVGKQVKEGEHLG